MKLSGANRFFRLDLKEVARRGTRSSFIVSQWTLWPRCILWLDADTVGMPPVSVDQSSPELLLSSGSERSAMGNRKMAATPLS